MNRYRYFWVICLIALAILEITARVFCATNVLAGEHYQAEVTDISGKKYFPAVKEALEEAEKSIYLVMFTIEIPPAGKNSKVGQLVNTLIEAKNRGVEVEVILDQNVDFVHRGHTSDWDIKIKSVRAYRRLKDAGITAHYDEPARYAHAKAVIIDKKIVIIGSTNWTESAFDNSIEADLLVNSAELADEILAYLKTIKIDEAAQEVIEIAGPSTRIDRDFLENTGLAPRMVGMNAMRDFDVYLYLLWKSGRTPLLFEDIAKYLGIYEGWATTDYRRQIIRAFKELEQRYELIKFQPRWGKEAEVTVLQRKDRPQRRQGIPNTVEGETGTFSLPDDYFNLGWNKELSLRAKFCYLINLAYTEISDTLPFWSETLPSITEQFGGVGRSVIIKGMEELRRKKLIEVKYDELKGKPFGDKAPKSYSLLKLYDPKDLKLRLKAIEDKHGRQNYAKAVRYARIVFEENNPQVIEDIILKTKQYGEKKIKKAFDIAALKNTDNPKKKYAYVVGTIEGME